MILTTSLLAIFVLSLALLSASVDRAKYGPKYGVGTDILEADRNLRIVELLDHIPPPNGKCHQLERGGAVAKTMLLMECILSFVEERSKKPVAWKHREVCIPIERPVEEMWQSFERGDEDSADAYHFLGKNFPALLRFHREFPYLPGKCFLVEPPVKHSEWPEGTGNVFVIGSRKSPTIRQLLHRSQSPLKHIIDTRERRYGLCASEPPPPNTGYIDRPAPRKFGLTLIQCLDSAFGPRSKIAPNWRPFAFWLSSVCINLRDAETIVNSANATGDADIIEALQQAGMGGLAHLVSFPNLFGQCFVYHYDTPQVGIGRFGFGWDENGKFPPYPPQVRGHMHTERLKNNRDYIHDQRFTPELGSHLETIGSDPETWVDWYHDQMLATHP